MRTDRPLARTSRRRGAKRPLANALALALASLLLTSGVAAPALALGPGDEAPDFSLERVEGKKSVSLSAYRGKVVWLDFWASWCAPCLKALPALEKMRKRLPAKHVQLLAINLDQDIKKARKFLKKSPVGYPSAWDPEGTLPEQYGVETMPTSILIDRKGVIRLVHKGFRSGDIEDIEAEIMKAVEGK